MMKKDQSLLSYSAVKERLSGRSHILLGNGFSIGCDPVFRYPSLYSASVEAGLSERAQSVFARLGTNNFEGVMRLLDDAHWVAKTYGLVDNDTSAMTTDVEVVKRALVDALAKSHLEHTGKIADGRKDAALDFLSTYHNIFTTNYDLLLYWVVMHRKDGPVHEDGFRADEGDSNAPYLVFAERLGQNRGIFYLHGALHLYLADGQLRKQSWSRSGECLTHLIRDGLRKSEYPLFVAEGSPEKKLAQIREHAYLWYCLDKFARIQNTLVVFGHSFGASDQHLADAIARNSKLSQLFVGLHGDPKSKENDAIRRGVSQIRAQRKEGEPQHALEVSYFDSDSARVWGEP